MQSPTTKDDHCPEWLDRSAYPFKSQYLTIDGNQHHYICIGSGPLLVFVHGTPSWSFDYRHLISTLKDRFTCLAFDHLGFGLSDKPHDADYSYAAQVQRTVKVIDHFRKQIHNQPFDQPFDLIVHDFGGPIMIKALQMADIKPRRITYLNTWLWSAESEPDFKQMRRLMNNALIRWAYIRVNLSAKYLLPMAFVDKRKLKPVHNQYLGPFASNISRYGMLGLFNSLMNDQAAFDQIIHDGWTTTIKSQVIWGMDDPLIKPSYLKYLISKVNPELVHRLHGVGHFPQEEAADQVVELVQRFHQS